MPHCGKHTRSGEEGEPSGLDLSALSSMLNARWKGGAPAAGSQPEPLSVGQIRSFRIVKLDHETEKIELKLV